MITPVLPFDTARDDALRKLRGADDKFALNIALAHATGLLRGYYLAGVVAPLVYKAARDQLLLEAERLRALAGLTEAVEHAERERTPHLELVK